MYVNNGRLCSSKWISCFWFKHASAVIPEERQKKCLKPCAHTRHHLRYFQHFPTKMKSVFFCLSVYARRSTGQYSSNIFKWIYAIPIYSKMFRIKIGAYMLVWFVYRHAQNILTHYGHWTNIFKKCISTWLYCTQC